MALIDSWGYTANWIFMGTLGIIGMFLGIWTYKMVQKEQLH